MKYKHLTIEEREKIQEMLWQKASVRRIAAEIGRNPASISRELQRNNPIERKRYTPRAAHERALGKRKSRGRMERLKNDQIRSYVVQKLKRRWSPEQIAGRIQADLKEKISHEAIYQYIYAQVHRNGWGCLRPGHEDLRRYLRRRRKRRIKNGTRRCQRIFKPKGVSIDMRPDIIDTRVRFGDWEGDSVESVNHKPGINTAVERKSGIVFITKLKDKTAKATTDAMGQRFKDVPKRLKQTITLDNGPENSDWPTIEKEIGLSCFYAHPYCSGERGTNENTNGLIRDYFPKKTDFSIITDEEIKYVESEINNRPRKRLDWKTPLEVWSVALQG
ncbi:MAG: IS30 family transposase [Parcubacteria group bacterium]|nr:IS30 family transposase [Parcubacteria group bacterium]MCR4342353.1 IS30 family transposase [Patescibacteria group bacterium]